MKKHCVYRTVTDLLDSLHFGKNYYVKLERLLVAGNWELADQETLHCMGEIANRNRGEILNVTDILNFPLLDLQNIDQLWTKHSHGKFGFTVQKKIWKSLYSPNKYGKDWQKFIAVIGWTDRKNKQLTYRNLTFDDKTAPTGHLPCSIYGLQPFRDLEQFEVEKCEWLMFEALAKRLESLKIPVQSAAAPQKRPAEKTPLLPEVTIDPNKPLKVFIAYSHKDEMLKEELEKHLSALKQQQKINPWQDRALTAGTEWDLEIKTQLEAAQLILLLITPDFMASDYIQDNELKRAIKQHQTKKALVIPIFLRPVDYKGASFAKLLALPKDAVPVTQWKNQDEAFLNIVEGIHQAVNTLATKR